MGCDIHMYLERKKEDGTWEDVQLQSVINLRAYSVDLPEGEHHLAFLHVVSRDYEWFGALTDGEVRRNANDMVRGLGHDLKPKGLPADMSVGLQQEADNWRHDMHNHNWLPLKVFLEVRAAYTGKLAEIVAARMRNEDRFNLGWTRYAEETFGLRYTFDDHPLENFRVIFWFDN